MPAHPNFALGAFLFFQNVPDFLVVEREIFLLLIKPLEQEAAFEKVISRALYHLYL